MEETKILTTLEEVKAMSDPFKYKILITYNKLDQPATVKQIADILKVVPAKVYYHVKKMESAGILKLVYTKEIKGIIAKYYEPTAKYFDIRCSGANAEPNKNILLAQNQQMIAVVYEDSKNTFMDQLAYCAQTEVKTKGEVSVEELYITDDEVEEFRNYINDFFSKYSNKERNATNVNKHHCFLSLIKIVNEK